MRFYIVGLFVVLSGCGQSALLTNDGAELTSDRGQQTEIITSETDDRQYRHIELDNGLDVILISDPEATTSAASMRVDVGSYADPVDREGMAHFLEHMLFLGTEKYPDSEDFGFYLDANGGRQNAYTASLLTNYHFSINTDAFAGAVDRFAQFFISPLFTEDLVGREKNAVHSEYSTRLGQDVIAGMEVIDTVINPKHPAAKFNVGNLETLADIDGRSLRAELIDFYDRYYTAEGMGLVLMSSAPLDELQAVAVAQFSAISNRGKVPNKEYAAVFAEGELPKVVEIEPSKDVRQLNLLFPMPSFDERYQANPLFYLSVMLGREGSGSLHDVLKSNGWINSLSAGPGVDFGNSDSFNITVSLTESGMGHIDEIIAAVFSQVDLIKREGVSPWRYEELSRLNDAQFRFSGKGSELHYVINVANNMIKFAPQDILRGPYLLTDYDAELIGSALDKLAADNVLVSLMAKGVETDKTMHFYGNKYRAYQPSNERQASWLRGQFDQLQLPPVNPYIPDSLALMSVQAESKPELLHDSGSIEVWHYPSTRFGVPRAYVQIAFDRADSANAQEKAAETLFYRLMAEQLNEISYTASTAGLSVSVKNGDHGALIEFGGFSDKLLTLAQAILPQLRQPSFSADQFERHRAKLQRELANREQRVPYRRLGKDMADLLIENRVSGLQLLEATRSVTLEKVLEQPKKLFADVQLQMLAGGNISARQTRQLIGMIEDHLRITPTRQAVILGERVIKIEPQEGVDIYVKKSPHPDAAVIRYVQGRDDSVAERARFALFDSLLHQPYFQELRTVQQLGYVVGVNNVPLDRVAGLVFMVQSPTVSAVEIDRATDKFLADFQVKFSAMDVDQFVRQRQAVVTRYREKPKNLAEQVMRYWSDLRAGNATFTRKEEFVKELEGLTLADMQASYTELFIDRQRGLKVVAPGIKGGITATITSQQQFQMSRNVYKR